MTEPSQAGGERAAVQRYEVIGTCGGNCHDIEPSPDGEWVSYEDHRAALSAPPAKWCAHCRKDTHSDNECWSTRAIGVHDAHPAPMQMPTAFAWPKDIAAQAAPVAAVALTEETLLGTQVWFDRKDVKRVISAVLSHFGIPKGPLDARLKRSIAPVAAVAQPVASPDDEDAQGVHRGVAAGFAAHGYRQGTKECIAFVNGARWWAALAASPSCERQDVGGGK